MSREPERGTFRMAAYAVCVEGGRVLLVRHRSGSWSLPGGRVEHAEDPFDAVVPEVAGLRRSSLVDVGLALARTTPPTGHVAVVPVGGLVEH